VLSAQTPSRLCPLQRHDLPGAVRPDDEWHRLVRQSSSRRVWRGQGRHPRARLHGLGVLLGPRDADDVWSSLFADRPSAHSADASVGADGRPYPCDRARARGVHGQRASDPSWRPSPEAERADGYQWKGLYSLDVALSISGSMVRRETRRACICLCCSLPSPRSGIELRSLQGARS
jgi:hypothetical protein